ncbi:MAG: hypothetical protein GX111_11285 [Clostridiales bacterium]|jgi:hypothetical protein|nr:hypothetical protein [Clostridiales bacterium]
MSDYEKDEFTGNPLMPYDPSSPIEYFGEEPQGDSLIGSGNNDGLTPACITSMQGNAVSFGRDWSAGLVTVGNITKLLIDSNGNSGFVFTSVNGVSYFFGGTEPYDYLNLEFIVTNAAPTMKDIQEISYYWPGSDSMLA